MTVAELIEVLSKIDGTRLVCIDTLGFHRGVFPMADRVETVDSLPVEANPPLAAVVLEPSKWP